jgi:hypothetical protein
MTGFHGDGALTSPAHEHVATAVAAGGNLPSASGPTEGVERKSSNPAGVSSHLKALRPRILIASAAAIVLVFFGAIFYLRQSGVSGSPETYLYLEVGGTLLSFCYAANALVRFRGTHDRTALILAFGFVLSGIIEAVAYFGLDNLLASGPAAMSHIPLGWMVSRTLLAVLLLAAIGVERYMPTARQPSKETAGALLVVAVAAYLTSAAFLAAPSAPVAHAQSLISRPWDLLPGALFFIAALSFYHRIATNKNPATLYDYTLLAVASLNVICHVSAAFSTRMFDGPFFLAELSKTAGYVGHCSIRRDSSTRCAAWR